MLTVELHVLPNCAQYHKFINVCEGFIWRVSQASLNHKNKYPANIIHVHVPR